MNIRLATINDIQTISHLYTEFYAYNADKQPKYYAVASELGEYPSSVINSVSGDIIIAEIDNIIVGFVHIEQDSTPPYPSILTRKFACIIDFIVSKQYRNNGIGHLLLDEAKRWTQSRNLEYLELMVLENNDIGIRFYEHECFTTVSRIMRLEYI